MIGNASPTLSEYGRNPLWNQRIASNELPATPQLFVFRFDRTVVGPVPRRSHDTNIFADEQVVSDSITRAYRFSKQLSCHYRRQSRWAVCCDIERRLRNNQIAREAVDRSVGSSHPSP